MRRFPWFQYGRPYFVPGILIPGSYVCEKLVLFRAYLFVRALLSKKSSSRPGKPVRTRWSRSGRDRCTLGRVAGAQKFFYPADVDKTIFLVLVREALSCTYVPLKCGRLFAF